MREYTSICHYYRKRKKKVENASERSGVEELFILQSVYTRMDNPADSRGLFLSTAAKSCTPLAPVCTHP